MLRKLKKNPYQVTSNIEIVPVVEVEPDHFIHFAKFGYLQPVVQPRDLKDLERKQYRITVLLFTAADELAEREGISSDEARQRFAPTKTADGNVVEPVNFLDYLNPEQRAEIVTLQQESQEIPQIVATLFTQYRMAHGLTVTETDEGSGGLRQTKLQVDEPWFPLNQGDRFRFADGTIIEIVSGYSPESGLVGTRPLMRDILPGETAFLLETGSSEYKLGDPEWSLKDTREKMSLAHISSVYRFYKEEDAASMDAFEASSEQIEEASEEEGKALPKSANSLSATPTQSRSTGKKSGSGSNTLVAATAES